MQPTETSAEAVKRVEALVQEAFAQLPAGATLKFSDGSDHGSCDDAESGLPRGRVFVEKRYNVVPRAGGGWPEEQAIPALVAFWEKQGYRVYDDGRDRRDPKFVVDTPDGYAVIVHGYDRGDHYDFTLSGSSPCVWENGTPEP
ncbi:hypothetical protein Ait01nite_077440 [Actinoplanes italicus]|uniref:Uncharacterized protein n=1 Tax=Actinoplanes italicus TaxID=113567 RepID=A0A2T0K424_9ACTN|nr:hypothetical protein [Actinoplanes italicus]PRX17618.1 hypothetical protein CLV67_115121 [Actinoplanes italicus]GIE34699.1 hypothetical protein Ait01nite_077440 [Actinoplanes italicus]